MKFVQFLMNLTHDLVWILGAFLVVIVLYKLLRKLPFFLTWRQALKRESVFLKLLPPAGHESSVEANEQLMQVLHGVKSSRSWKDRLLYRQVVMSAEMPSTREDGIGFVLQVDKQLASVVHREITTHTASVKVTEAPDYLPKNLPHGKVMVVYNFSV